MLYDGMDAVHMDVLREIGNIGAGNATTALATLINTKIDMKVPKVELVGFQQLALIVGDEEELMAAVMVTLSNDVNGMMMFLMDKESVAYLIGKLMASSGMPVNEEFGEVELSVISEIGNIITGSYLSALSSLLNMKIDMSIPYLSIDMAGAILSVPAIEFGKIGDEVLLIQTGFGGETEVNGFFILIPDQDSYSRILSALGM